MEVLLDHFWFTMEPKLSRAKVVLVPADCVLRKKPPMDYSFGAKATRVTASTRRDVSQKKDTLVGEPQNDPVRSTVSPTKIMLHGLLLQMLRTASSALANFLSPKKVSQQRGYANEQFLHEQQQLIGKERTKRTPKIIPQPDSASSVIHTLNLKKKTPVPVKIQTLPSTVTTLRRGARELSPSPRVQKQCSGISHVSGISLGLV